MREPGIHITEIELSKALSAVWGEENIMPGITIDFKQWAKLIVKYSKNKQLTHRGIFISNEKAFKKSERLVASRKNDASLFASLLTLCRRRVKHRGVKTIEPGDKDWLMIKELTQMANEVCNEFSFERKIGYEKYIVTSLKMIKNYSINKIKSLHSVIFNRIGAELELDADITPELTEEVYLSYISMVNEKTGINYDEYKDNPEKRLCFMKCKMDAERLGITPKTMVKAQFYCMDKQDLIPDPAQLYGDKAIGRLKRYMSENNITVRKDSTINFKKIRRKKK